MKNILRFLIFAFVFGCIFGGVNYVFAANIDFTVDTEVNLTGLSTALYIASSSAADLLVVNADSLNANIPAGSVFALKTSSQTKLSISLSGDSVNLNFNAVYFGSGYITQWTASSSVSTTTVAFSVGVPLVNTYYKINVNGALLDYYLSNSSGIVSFTYSGGFSDKVFTIIQEDPPSSGASSGGGVAIALLCNPSIAPTGGFRIIINNGDPETVSRNVILAFNAGLDAKRMVISNYFDFRYTIQESYSTNKNWMLTEGDGIKTVYVKFFSECGAASEIVSDVIILKEKKLISQVLRPQALIKQITKQLIKGMKNDEVRNLQEFLAQDKEIYPEGLITDYYGSLTQKAVQRFQKKYSIAKEGDVGFGAVGPKTRAKINELISKLTILELPEQTLKRIQLIQQIRSQIQILQEKLVQLMNELVIKLQEQVKQKAQ